MNYKSGVAIMVTYQAANAATGLTIQMDVYDEGHALDAPSSGSMAEILATGRYYKEFTPDAAGEWIVLIKNNADGGEVVKAFRVATADEFGIKAVADTIDTATGATGGIRGADGDSLKSLSDQIDAVSVPAMVG